MAGHSQCERGSVITELSIVAPVLFFITVFVTDFGLFLQSYFRAMHIAREGVKTAVAVPGLEAGIAGAGTSFSGIYSVKPGASTTVVSRSPLSITQNHNAIHERVRRLLLVANGSKRSLQLAKDEITIASECVRGDGGKVRLSVSGVYSPLLPLEFIFGPGAGFRFTARAEGDYLFSNCAG